MKRSEADAIRMTPTTTSNSYSKSQAENSTNTINSRSKIMENGGADQMPTLPPRIEPSSFSTAVDVGPDTNRSPKKNPQASFWARLTKAATVVEEHLAEFFGLNDSKYQWAVDEAMNRQLAGESQVKPAPSEAPNELQTEPTSQQAMHRDTNGVDSV